MTYGGPLVCFIWLTNPLLLLKHVVGDQYVCLCFGISREEPLNITLFVFLASIKRSPWQLRRSHRLTWVMVIIFLTDLFVSIVLFGVQKQQFRDWCVQNSREDVSSFLTSEEPYKNSFNSSTPIIFASKQPNNNNIYNCEKLWEDEIKFACILYVILFTLYVHFAFCFWRYTQERWSAYEAMMRLNMMQNESMVPNIYNNTLPSNNANTMMMNISSSQSQEKENTTKDNQKSLSQITEEFIKRVG
ncbi:hypothetical protein A0J61_03415 [Choanephora cucurbitarum]|uniref:G-protein coupled receptors family 1 profile domain-containing protein n=1 Tax=Choanephora cucurbitarum TaxID=101091 RepID=A0A1C7NJ73_9FUNG|nr:hypothetical protein A0J61_03415 [Choanephora cucurbitarum]